MTILWTDGRPVDSYGAFSPAWADGAPIYNDTEIIGVDVTSPASHVTLTPRTPRVFNTEVVFGVKGHVTLAGTGTPHVDWEIAQPRASVLMFPRHAFVFNERYIPSFETRVYVKLSAVAEKL